MIDNIISNLKQLSPKDSVIYFKLVQSVLSPYELDQLYSKIEAEL